MIRLLRFGHTLRWLPDEDDDPQGPGAWHIDLTARSARHKTRYAQSPPRCSASLESQGLVIASPNRTPHCSRFYGPAMTRLPDTFGQFIGAYKQAREATTEYEFEQAHEAEGGYLFASKDGRPFSVSTWRSVVKETFRRYSGLAPPPKLLRAIFIVWLRDEAHHNAATPDVLRSCAKLMKHQLQTQESDGASVSCAHDGPDRVAQPSEDASRTCIVCT